MGYKEEQLALTEKAEERFLCYLSAYKKMLSNISHGYEARFEDSIKVFKVGDFLKFEAISEHIKECCRSRPLHGREALKEAHSSFARTETSLSPLLIENPHTLKKRERSRGGRASYYGILDDISHKDREWEELKKTDLERATIPDILRRNGIEVQEKRMVMPGLNGAYLQRPQDILVINRTDAEYTKKLNAVNSELEALLEVMQNKLCAPAADVMGQVAGITKRKTRETSITR